MKMTGRQRKTLASIFTDPIPANIAWADVERLLKALRAELSEGRGSRIRIFLRGVRAVFHRPHPRKEVNRGAVKSVRRFLMEAGINPDN